MGLLNVHDEYTIRFDIPTNKVSIGYRNVLEVISRKPGSEIVLDLDRCSHAFINEEKIPKKKLYKILLQLDGLSIALTDTLYYDKAFAEGIRDGVNKWLKANNIGKNNKSNSSSDDDNNLLTPDTVKKRVLAVVLAADPFQATVYNWGFEYAPSAVQEQQWLDPNHVIIETLEAENTFHGVYAAMMSTDQQTASGGTTTTLHLNQTIRMPLSPTPSHPWQASKMYLQFAVHSVLEAQPSTHGYPTYTLRVLFNDSTIATIDSSCATSYQAGYTLLDVDITHLADGTDHMLSFALELNDTYTTTSNLYIDNICIYSTPSSLLEYDIYVSPTTGDDWMNDGSSWATPFQSIQKAVDSVAQGYTINLEAATYPLTIADSVFTRGKSLTVVGATGPAGELPSFGGSPGMFLVVLPESLLVGDPLTCPLGQASLSKSTFQNLEFRDITTSPDNLAKGCVAISLAQYSIATFTNINVQSISNLDLGPVCTYSQSFGNFANSSFTNVQSTIGVLVNVNATIHVSECQFSGNRVHAVRSTGGVVSMTNNTLNTLGIYSHSDVYVGLTQMHFANIPMHDTDASGVITLTHSGQVEMSNVIVRDSSIYSILSASDIAMLTMTNVTLSNLLAAHQGVYIGTVAAMEIHHLKIANCTSTSTLFYEFVMIYDTNGSLDHLAASNLVLVGTKFNLVSVTGSTLKIGHSTLTGNRVPLLLVTADSTVTLHNMTLLTNSQYALIVCDHASLSITNSNISNNLVNALESTVCNVYIDSTTLTGNTNAMATESALVGAIGGALNIVNSTFNGNVGFDILIAQQAAVATLTGCTFRRNPFGRQIVIKDQSELIATDMLVTGNREMQPVITLFDQVQAIMQRVTLRDNVYPLIISNASIDFNDVNVLDTMGGDTIVIESATGSWINSVISNCSASLLSTPLSLSQSTLVFDNMTMYNLSSSNHPLGVLSNGSYSFNNCTFIGSIGSIAGGFLIQNSQVSFTVSTFQTNVGKESAVMHATDGSTVSITNALVDNNIASNSIMLFENSNYTITSTSFTRNLLAHTMSAVSAIGVITDCVFLDNSAQDSVVSLESSPTTIADTRFLTGYTLSDGSYSSIDCDLSQVTITNASFSNNLGTSKPSVIVRHSMFTLTDVTFTNNSNLYGNGVLYIEQSRVWLTNVDFHAGIAHLGGCLYSVDSRSIINDCNFYACAATSGGAIFFEASSSTITNSRFTLSNAVTGDYTNTADDAEYLYNGGAIAIWRDHDPNPGRLLASASSSLAKTFDEAFEEKRTKYAPLWAPTKILNAVTIIGTQFTENYAMLDGGGVWIKDESSTLTIQSAGMKENRAGGGGGAVYSEIADTLLNLTSTLFINNSAIYGPDYATSPVKIAVSYPAPIQRAVPFPVVASLLDAYDQVVANHPSYSFSIVISTPSSNETYTKQAIPYLGSSTFYPTLLQPVGTLYRVNLTITDVTETVLFTNQTDIIIAPCLLWQRLVDEKCQSCPPGMVGGDGISCFACPDRTTCPDGTVYPLQGYWMATSLYDSHIYKCNPSVCVGGAQRCRDLHTGVLCGTCVPGASKSLIFCTGETLDNFYLFPLFNFRLDYIPTHCLSPKLNYLAKYFIGMGSMAAIVGLVLLLQNTRHIKRALGIVVHLIPFHKRAISAVLFFYVPITYLSASVLPCRKVEGEHYLVIDQTVKCYTPTHITSMLFALIALACVSAALPLYLLRRLPLYKTLFIHVKSNWMYWDLIKVGIAAAFAVVSVVLPYYEVEPLILVSMVIIYVGVLWFNSPYKQTLRNSIEALQVFLLLLGCLTSNSRLLVSVDAEGYVLMTLCGLVIRHVWICNLTKYAHAKEYDSQVTPPTLLAHFHYL
eukprot:gene5955-6898_t